MPNWCMNSVKVSGEREDINAFKDLVTSEDCAFDFNKIIPMPKELEDTKDWCINNWGTKWNVSGLVNPMEDEGDHIRYDFDTAWSPPQGIYHALQNKFPDLSITWFIDGEGTNRGLGYL